MGAKGMAGKGLQYKADKSVAYPGHSPPCFAELEVLGQVGVTYDLLFHRLTSIRCCSLPWGAGLDWTRS
jgi:hypothetical protein